MFVELQLFVLGSAFYWDTVYIHGRRSET